VFGRKRGCTATATHELGRERQQAVVPPLRPAVFERDVVSVDIAGLAEALPEGAQAIRPLLGRGAAEVLRLAAV
jgi:hypothetical protein